MRSKPISILPLLILLGIFTVSCSSIKITPIIKYIGVTATNHISPEGQNILTPSPELLVSIQSPEIIQTEFILQTCIKASSFPIRIEPRFNSATVGYVKTGDCIDIEGKSQDGKWLKIKQGWIESTFLASSTEFSKFPIFSGAVRSEATLALFSTVEKPTPTITKIKLPSITSSSILTITPTNTFVPTPITLPTNTLQPFIGPNAISWDEVKYHIGERTIVCGPIVDANYASDTSGQPTFLNMGRKYPDPERFTIFIWGDDRSKFPFAPESYYLGKNICVEGLIETYKGNIEIEVKNPSQITLQ